MALLITLQDLLVRPPSLDWFEAVAIVQSVCAEALRLADGDGPTIPDRQAVLLNPSGGVEFAARVRRTQAPVIAAATLLNELLAPDRTPAQLRSLAKATLDSPTRYASLEDFSGALAYFDRPGREKVLRDVFERARAAAETDILQPIEAMGLDEFPSESSESSPRALQPAARADVSFARATDEGHTASPPPSPPASIRHLTLLVAASSVLLVAIGIATNRTWQMPDSVETRLPPPSPPPLFVAATAPPAWPLKPTSELEPDRGALVQARANTAALRIGTRSGLAGSPGAGRRAREGAHSSAQAAMMAVELAQPRAPAVPVVESANSGVATPNSSQDQREAIPHLQYEDNGPKPGAAGSARVIYSAADTSVQPPVGIRPRYWTEPPPGVRAQSLTRIEILVSETGEVESTRIVAGPRTYFDGLTLAAVKGWTFKPAIRDGRPVAYRQQVWLAIAER